MKITRSKEFANGKVYALVTEDGFPIEVTDTFLPYYTKDACHIGHNKTTKSYTDRSERWMIGVSCMSGCPVGCKFCATGQLNTVKLLTAQQIVDQVKFVIDQNRNFNFQNAKEHKINYTRMGEPFFNIENVKKAIEIIEEMYPGTHHYVSTIGVKNSDFSWIKGNITLQLSLHSLDEDHRNKLIPSCQKMSIEELGKIRTQSNLKTTVNMTLVSESDFDINKLKKHFDPNYFFIKLSPINPNLVSVSNEIGLGVISETNV